MVRAFGTLTGERRKNRRERMVIVRDQNEISLIDIENGST
jgi:hypothetical protein